MKKMNVRATLWRPSSKVLAVFLIGASATAAAAQSVGPVPEAASADSASLQDIIVTARRTNENVQKVPIAIQSLSGNALTTANVTNIIQLDKVTPGLQYTVLGSSLIAFLRGVGSVQVIPGLEAPVAFYVDGIYTGSKNSNAFDLINVERVEVLKGPQGTLFGRNATGGAIQVVTRDPGQRRELEAEVGYGRFNEFRARGYVAGPITEKLAIAFAASTRSDSGYIYNSFLDEKANKSRSVAAMAKLLWEPSPELSVRLTGSYFSKKDPTYQAAHTEAGTIPTIVGLGFTAVYGDYELRSDHRVKIDSITKSGTLRVDYDLGPAKAVSLTGYVYNIATPVSNTDMSESIRAYSGGPAPSKQFSQEFQLQSNRGSAFTWITGLYYLWSKESLDNLAVPSNVPFPIRPIDLTQPGASVVGISTNSSTKAYAAFAEGNYQIANRLKLTGGVRYSRETKGIIGSSFFYRAVPGSGSPGDLFGTVAGRPSDNLVFGTTPLASMDRKQGYSKVTWRAALSYDIGEHAMVYASYNRGFKSGGFNSVSINPAQVPLKPEVIDAYEIGFKSELFDRRLRLNVSAFRYDYSGIQVATIGANNQQNVENAGTARMYGIDAELLAAVTNNLTLRATGSFLDSQYRSFPNATIILPRTAAVCPTTQVALTPEQAKSLTVLPQQPGSCTYKLKANGLDTVFSPRFSGTAGFSYKAEVGTGRVVLDGTLFYTDHVNTAPGGFFARIKAHENLTLSATYYFEDDHAYIRLWGDNLTDSRHPVVVQPNNLGFQEINARPLTYGITVGIKI